ncbi:hypothetical protein SLEP1_g16624 [Rubroshorea leprosula]|uniref:Uncharacterized protein n=1 Tax=Rubroshorea leprosula TaxID=152421 RepID=A0AAV5J0A2_9ROSI|nr:hypothetical protein SLEP1_g16624 [Rubroshorea leprosula]
MSRQRSKNRRKKGTPMKRTLAAKMLGRENGSRKKKECRRMTLHPKMHPTMLRNKGQENNANW